MHSEPRIVLKCADDGSKAVRLTSDDILTLKLLRDEYSKYRNPHRSDEYDCALETLERILKQVG